MTCDLFHLTNIVKFETCFTKIYTSLIDLILTNKPSSFNITLVTETGLSDYYKTTTTFFKLHFSRLRPQVITYRNYKKFHEEKFLNDLKETNIIMNEKDPNQNYQSFTKTFLTIVNKHAPLKKKIVRGNQAPFMTKKFQKAIYTRSRLKNKMNKNPTEKNITAYKRQRNLCVSLRRKNIKSFFNNVTKTGIITNKNFWTFIKPFLTNKGFFENKNITLIEGNKIKTNERELAKTFNEHYINIVEKNSGIKPKDISQCDKNQNIHKTIKEIVKSYENHSSILQIKHKICSSSFHVKEKLRFHFVNEIEIKKLMQGLNPKKATGIDTISPKLIKVAVEFLTPLLTKSINSSTEHNIFPDLAKTALVIPLDKGKPNKNNITNFRPVSILNTFSKIYEKVIKNQLLRGMENVFLPQISAYRKSYNSQHVLIRLIEEWREYLDKDFVVGTVMTYLSKAFDCIPHDLLIAKLEAYGLGEKALSYIFSYLTNRNQCVCINIKKVIFKRQFLVSLKAP